PLNRRLYVVNEGSSSLSVFAIVSTGALIPLPFSPISIVGDCATVAVHPNGSPVLVGTNGGVVSIVVTATTSTVAAGSPFATAGASLFGSAISRDGAFY